MVITKVHKGVRYRVSDFMKSFIDFNIARRREAQKRGDSFGKDFYKLANNSVYGKSFENVRQRFNVHIVGGGEERRLLNLFKQPHFESASVLPDSQMVMVRMGQIKLTFEQAHLPSLHHFGQK